jgi:hypothetical protein
MKKNRFLLNKYTVGVYILLAYFALDMFLHKGMLRVLLPAASVERRYPIHFTPCGQTLVNTGKKWVKAVNTVQAIEDLPRDTPGFEMDVYFDTVKNCLLLYHDSANYSTLNIEAVLKVYKEKNLSASIWLDFKNLFAHNEQQSLRYITALRKTYGLTGKLIIESSLPQCLQSFCDSGFFTSYYVPFFNPYRATKPAQVNFIDTVSANIRAYPTTALSGYYFQYPLLKEFFPGFPILTWAEKPGISFTAAIFNRKLLKDSTLQVILYNQ